MMMMVTSETNLGVGMGCWNEGLHVALVLPGHTSDILLVLLKSRVQSMLGINALIQSKTSHQRVPVLQKPPGLKRIGLKILLQRHKYSQSCCQQ